MEADPPSVEVSSLGLPAGTSCTTLALLAAELVALLLAHLLAQLLWQLHIRVSHFSPFFELSLVLLTTKALGL